MTADARIKSSRKQAKAATPAGMVPKVRQPEFDLAEDVPRYWWDNDPARTLLLAALSATFPPGERFFINSVRHYRDQITDPELKEAVRAFIGQEAHHSKEHDELNNWLQARGIGVERLEREVGGFINWMAKNFSPERQLAHTVAVEHFTALMAEEFLLKYDALEEMDPRMAPIWAWHAVEESEHKAVAFDVYKAIGGSEFTRISEMAVVSVLFPLFTAVHVAQLMKEEGQLTNVKSWVGLGKYLFASPGVVRKLLPSYFKYYSPNFHPWQTDSRSLVEKAKKKWLGAFA
jgi:predicted metal-dependent hydrolase